VVTSSSALGLLAVLTSALGAGTGGVLALAAFHWPNRNVVALLRNDDWAEESRTPGRADPSVIAGGRSPRWFVEAAGWLGRMLTAEESLGNRVGLGRRLSAALSLTGQSAEQLGAQVLLGMSAGALLPPVVWTMLMAGGVRLSFGIPVWASVVLAASGASLGVLELRSRAKQRRHQARRAVSCLLDLVVLALAGGMGTEGALQAAVSMGDDWLSRRLAHELERARHAGMPPWTVIGELGERLGLVELREWAGAMRLAGTEGARVRASLSAKAASLRQRMLSDAEAEANATTQRLFLPGSLLLLGFLLFIGYPAFERVLTGIR
jgi:tight adherence protein C